MDWHNLSYNDVMQKFSVSKNGLASRDIKRIECRYGKNVLLKKESSSIIKKILEQFSDFMVLVLLAASVVSFVTALIDGNNNYADPIIILSIVLFNSVLGAFQEIKAEKAIDSLEKLSSSSAKVIRDCKQIKIESKEVVPGDIIVIESGDFLPADARLIESHNLKVEESSITGESSEIRKCADAVLPVDTPIADRENMVFSSSFVVSGHGKAVVVETGMNTEVGKIAKLINEEQKPQTPLQKKLTKIGKILGICIIIISVFIFLLGLVQGKDMFETFMISVSLAVAAIPEGLPAVVTIVLAIGIKKMAQRNTIVRKLEAVETLGNASVICSDKTGTLTQNKMTVVQLCSLNGIENEKSDISGEILECGALCNNSKIDKETLCVKGEPTENAILTAAVKNGKDKNLLDKKYFRVKEIPFDSSRKVMTTVHKNGEGKYKVVTKGAPETILGLCAHCCLNCKIFDMDENLADKARKIIREMTQKSLRVLAVAYKETDNLLKDYEIESKLILLGFIGITDPPRKEVKSAIDTCIKSGIKTVMITGDHPYTASAIALELGILTKEKKLMTGSELEKIDQEKLVNIISDYSVFSRVSPQHKVRIVKAFQSNGNVVAMTGDGVNDAPALKVSDIGCAMGKSGTDVAKAASDIVLMDDNFSTIVEAIRQGKGLFENIKKSIHFLLSTNIGEIFAVLAAFVCGIPSPLTAIQLLWINLVTDSFPALALGMEPIDPDIMSKKARKNIFSLKLWISILIEGSFIGTISLLAFSIGRVFFDLGLEPISGRTMAFTTLGLSQIIHAFNVRSEKPLRYLGFKGNKYVIYAFILCSFLQISVVSIPKFCDLFGTERMGFFQWVIVFSLSLTPLLISEIEKCIISRYKLKKSATL